MLDPRIPDDLPMVLELRSPGTSTKDLMTRMGHASSQAAIKYQHATNDRDGKIAEALSEMIELVRTRDEADAEIIELPASRPSG